MPLIGPAAPPVLPRVQPARVVRTPTQPQKNPGLAAILSFFWPGLGQFYNGNFDKGLLMICFPVVVWPVVALSIVGILIVPHLLIVAVFACLIVPILWLWSVIDAYQSAERYNRRRR